MTSLNNLILTNEVNIYSGNSKKRKRINEDKKYPSKICCGRPKGGYMQILRDICNDDFEDYPDEIILAAGQAGYIKPDLRPQSFKEECFEMVTFRNLIGLLPKLNEGLLTKLEKSLESNDDCKQMIGQLCLQLRCKFIHGTGEEINYAENLEHLKSTSWITSKKCYKPDTHMKKGEVYDKVLYKVTANKNNYEAM